MSAAVETPVQETPVEIPEIGKPNSTEDESKSPAKSDGEMKERRRHNGPRKLPRSSSPNTKDNGHRRSRAGSFKKGDRRRPHTSVSSSSESESNNPLTKLRDTVLEKYERKGLNLLNSYVRNRKEFAKFDNTTKFLQRCQALRIVPVDHRIANYKIKNTKAVLGILNRYSFLIVSGNLRHHRERRSQIEKLLAEKLERMKELFDQEVFDEIIKLSDEVFDLVNSRIKEQKDKSLESLLKEYNLNDGDLKEGEERYKESEERYKEHLKRRALEREQRAKERQNRKNESQDENGIEHDEQEKKDTDPEKADNEVKSDDKSKDSEIKADQ